MTRIMERSPAGSSGAGAPVPPDTPFPVLLSEFKLGTRRLRNRVAHASMSTLFSKDGQVTERLIGYHANRARGGAALIVTGALASQPWQVGSGRVHVHEDTYLDGLSRWAEAVEGLDTRLLGQLMDPGRGRHHPGRNPSAVGASALPDDISLTVPHALTIAEIQRLIERFAGAAARLQRAGFSGVEFSCGHGHLFHQFLSPWSNRREDAYGGDIAGRTRLIRELVEAVRAACGRDFLIGLKMPGDDGVPGSIGPELAVETVRHLAPLVDVSYFSFAQGTHHRTLEMHVPDMHTPRLPYLELTRMLREAAPDVPVVALGRITEPGQAERILSEGAADVVMMGRTLLADPAWAVKAAEGREDEIRTCLSCNTCWGEIIQHKPICCVANPRVGTPDEATWTPRPARKVRRVVVVGGGVAGLEAAWVAAARGHTVTLFGASSEVGGKLRLHASLPGCDSLSNLYSYQYPAAVKAGVAFELGYRADLQAVLDCKPDAVVLAAGSSMTWPAMLPQELHTEGLLVDLRETVRSLLGRKGRTPGTAVLYDRDATVGTYDAAEWLQERFERVVLITPREQLAQDEPLVTRQGVYRRLYSKRIEVVLLSDLLGTSAFIDGKVAYANVYHGEEGEVSDVALFTYATPRVPDDALAAPLMEAGVEVRVVGDCYAPRTMLLATREGHAVGNEL